MNQLENTKILALEALATTTVVQPAMAPAQPEITLLLMDQLLTLVLIVVSKSMQYQPSIRLSLLR